MNIQELLKEYNLEIDDVRWYLSNIMTERLLSNSNNPDEIIRYIWSGELNDELYNMEERYIQQLQDQKDENTLDESHIRDIMNDMDMMRRKRYGY